MKLFIKIGEDSQILKAFMYNYLPNYMSKLFLKWVNIKRLNTFEGPDGINLVTLVSYALRNQTRSKAGDMYIIGVNKNLKYNGEFIISYLNHITYGDLTHKGYPILPQIFKYVSERINIIYEEWLEKWQ